MPSDLIYLNGVNGATGEYLVQPMSSADLAALVLGEPPPDQQMQTWFKGMKRTGGVTLALPFNIQAENIPKAGWSVVFAAGESSAVKDALQPLIKHRQGQVAPDRCKVLEYRAGEGLKEWLARHGVGSGTITPAKLGYYVLLAGDPSLIPFEFQYLLDIEYAVGRVCFDTPDQYRQYAESVVAYEKAASVPNAKEIVYWGTRHGSRDATQMSADWLLTPLHEGLADDPDGEAIAELLSYRSRCFKAKEATKATLSEVLHARGDAPRPAFLFTASHGLGWPRNDPRQLAAQGALLAQDWSGFGATQPAHYLAADDVKDDARVHGLVAFLFACFGAGTPSHDNFLYDRTKPAGQIADKPFISRLPQRLLSHPQGGALAVIGHIERAWGYSIRPLDESFKPIVNVGPQLAPFRNCLGHILAGTPVGHATKDISEKFAILSTDLLGLTDEAGAGPRPAADKLVWVWVERNDARNYILLGDPAVRLRTELLR